MSNNIRISYVIGGMGAGGKERQLLYLIKALVENYSVQLIVFSENVFYKEIYELPLNLIIFPRKDKYTFRTAITVFKELIRFKPSIIQAWSNYSQLLVLPYVVCFKVKVVNSSIRSASKLKKSIITKLINKIAYVFSHVIVSNSEAGLAINNLHNLKKAMFIHNGLDAETFRSEQPVSNIEKVFCNKGSFIKFKVVMVARFFPLKDYYTYIEAARMVLSSRTDVGFFCIGDGPARQQAEKQAGQYLNNNIFFLGNRSDVQQIMHFFHIGVILNNVIGYAEGISNAIMEYMAAGLPVIATSAGGTPELVRNQQSGILVPAFDSQLVAEKILYLLENENEMKKMGLKGIEIIEKDFCLKKMTASYVKLYRRLLNE